MRIPNTLAKAKSKSKSRAEGHRPKGEALAPLVHEEAWHGCCKVACLNGEAVVCTTTNRRANRLLFCVNALGTE